MAKGFMWLNALISLNKVVDYTQCSFLLHFLYPDCSGSSVLFSSDRSEFDRYSQLLW